MGQITWFIQKCFHSFICVSENSGNIFCPIYHSNRNAVWMQWDVAREVHREFSHRNAYTNVTSHTGNRKCSVQYAVAYYRLMLFIHICANIVNQNSPDLSIKLSLHVFRSDCYSDLVSGIWCMAYSDFKFWFTRYCRS